jgi:hypothetical protein
VIFGEKRYGGPNYEGEQPEKAKKNLNQKLVILGKIYEI